MLNKANLIGRLVRDPELRYLGNGTAVANFTLAVKRTFKNKDGEREADFINIQVWRKQAENVANYLAKGSLVAVAGRIQTRNFEGKDGNRVYVTEVVAEEVNFLDSKKKDAGDSQEPYQDLYPIEDDSELPF